MEYKGVIIRESLTDVSVFQKVRIVKTDVESITPRHKTPWVKQWTLYTVEVEEEKAKEIASILSKNIDTSHDHPWYADFKNDKFHYIIYPNKIFKVDLSNPVLFNDAQEYGITLGIPKYQVDFS